MGQNIKVEESYASEYYFAFSKSASIQEIELPQTYRKIQKCYGANNAFLPFLDSYIASTFSNAHSSCKVTVNNIACYMTAVLWSLYYLMHAKGYKNLPNKAYTAILLTPSVVGGLPIIYLHNMYVRAESDLLTPFIDLVKFSENTDQSLHLYLRNFCRHVDEIDPNIMGLIMDPYSINNGRPTLPDSILRQEIKPYLIKAVRNETIRELLNVDSEETHQQFLDALKSFNVYSPKVLSNLFAATPRGVITEFIRKFETSRSVYELLVLRVGPGKANRILRSVIKRDQRVQSWRINRIIGRSKDRSVEFDVPRNQCSAQISENIRSITWKKSVEGITMPALQHLIHLTTPYYSSNDPWACSNHFTYNQKQPTRRLYNDNSIQYSTAGVKPFLGHSTSSGTLEPDTQFIMKDNVLIKLKNLMDLASWTSKQGIVDGAMVESNVEEFIKRIFTFFTTKTLRELAPFAGTRKSGTIAHHIRAPSFKESIVPNCLSNVYQHFSTEASSHERFTNSSEHFYINFLHIMCYTISLLTMESEFEGALTSPQKIWAVTTDCNFCSRVIHETPLRFDPKKLPTADYRPLEATIIGEASTKILQESHSAFLEERVRPLEDATRVIDFTIHDAYTGIINELIDYSYYIVKGIHDRYSTRVMTANTFEILSSLIPKRKTKVIGFREIKWMEMELTGPIIATSIAIQAEENFLSKSNEELSGKIRATPSHDLPWYNLIRTLYLAGRLNDYLRWQYSLTGLRSPPGHLTHDNVTGFIGVSSLQIMTRNMTTPPLVILSYYDRVAIGQQVKKMAYMQRWKILRNHYLQDLDIRHTLRTGTYYTLATPLLEEAILLSCITVDKAAYDEYILETLQGGNTGEVQILTTEFMDLEDIPQTVEEARNISSCLNYLIDKFQDFDWPSMLDNVFNRFQDIIEKTEPLLRNSTMRVVYSTVTTCINEIRAMLARDESASSDTDEANRQKELTDNWQESQDRIRYRGVKLKPCDLNIRTGQRADQHPTVRYNVNYEPTERVILNTASMGCIYGTTTRGGSKLLEIMSRLNIDVPIDSYQCFATLGEGTGGFLQMLASLSESCLFVYCSLREGEDKDVLSIQAKDTILMNSHVCFTDHIINGFDDLTYPETMHQLEKYQLKYAMVTLDAENVNDSNRLSVLHNSITFYLRNTTDTGIFICKIYLREVFINGYAIQYLQEFCKVVQVLRLHASRPNDEHYIVAYGRGQFDTIPEYGLRNDFISQPLMDSLALFTHRFITAYNEIKDQKYTTINLYHQYDRYLRRCHNYQEYYVVGLLQRQLGLSLTNQDLIYIFNIVMTEQSLYSARSLINDEYESLFFTHIWNMDKPFLKNQPFDNNTFRGIISLAHRWLILRGYKRFLELVATLQAGSRVNLTTVWTRQVYLEEVSKLPARTQLANSSKRMFYTTCKIKGVTTQGYFSLIRGIDIGILLLSTWRYHKYQR